MTENENEDKEKEIAKSLSPEEVTVLDNISTMIEQLKASGMNTVDSEITMAAAMPEKEEEKEDEEIIKKANEGPTANPETKAEDRVEEPTDITAGNLSEVGKSLALLAPLFQSLQKKNTSVKKSSNDQTNAIVMKSLEQISNVMKSLADQQSQQNTAIQNILEGIGFTEKVQKSLEVKKVATPVGSLDNAGILNELVTVLKGLNNGNNITNQPNNWNVKKNQHVELAEALPSIFNVNK